MQGSLNRISRSGVRISQGAPSSRNISESIRTFSPHLRPASLPDTSASYFAVIARESDRRSISIMINCCFNPKCSKELRYLRDGRVVRIIHGDGDQMRPEHFWLCGHCSRFYEFVFAPDGSVGLNVRSGTKP